VERLETNGQEACDFHKNIPRGCVNGQSCHLWTEWEVWFCSYIASKWNLCASSLFSSLSSRCKQTSHLWWVPLVNR